MIQETNRGIELRFEEPVNVVDLVGRINKEMGITNPTITQLAPNSRSHARIGVAGETWGGSVYGYSMVLEPTPNLEIPIDDVNSRILIISYVGYKPLTKVHDELIALTD